MDEHELALAVAAEAPVPDPAFARQLDERVARGFPRDGRTARLTHARARAATALRTRAAAALRKRPPLAIAGGIASVLIALVVATTLIDDDAGPAPDGANLLQSNDPPAAQQESSGGAAEPAIVKPYPDASRARLGRDTPLVLPAPPVPRPGFAPGTRDRRIERSATLALAAPDERLDRVAADIAAVTERHRGFVLNSQLATGDEGTTTGGQFELRIPAARLDTALADLAKLGQVRSQTTAGRDVTAAFVTAGDRLEAARAERTGLLTRLENADGDNAAAALRLQLDANVREINRLEGRIAGLRVRANYANVAVTLESTDSDGAIPIEDDDGLGAALDDAADSASGALELLIRVLGVLIPLGLVAAVVALAARALLRRRRESALG